MAGGEQRSGGVHRVVPAGQGRGKMPAVELPAVAVGLKADIAVLACAESQRVAPAAGGQHARQGGVLAIHHDSAGAGDGAQQMLELALDGGQIGEDVRMIKLEVIQHQRSRAKVHKL